MRFLTTALWNSFIAQPGGVNNDFYNDIGGRFFEDEAPAGAEFPFAVFQVVTSAPERTFTEYFRETLLQISLFSLLQNPVPGEIKDMYDHQKALFDEKPLNITGNTLLWMREKNLTTLVDEITTPSGTVGVKHWAVDYEIKAALT
jgi:hypothetical protein